MNPELLSMAQAAGRHIEPADLHGSVCGMAAARPEQFDLGALIDLLGTDVIEDADTAETFVAASLDDFYAQDLEFYPLVPDDEVALADRVAGMAAWCAGFVGGFGATMTGSLKELPDEVAEVLRDFASISAIDEDAEDSDQNEASFMEILEYVKVGAVLALTLMREHLEGGESASEGATEGDDG